MVDLKVITLIHIMFTHKPFSELSELIFKNIAQNIDQK